jgi:pimeloyl-ACP methyl ester carboxylesterase
MEQDTAMSADRKPMATAATRVVEVDGAPIHLTEWGRGRPVLLLHGNPDSGAMWSGVASRLGRDFHCIAPDLPGFGHSEVPRTFVRSLDGMAKFVAALCRACRIAEPADLVVHDFGGPFGLAWAVQHPQAVRRIVAINTVFFSDYRWHFWGRVWRTPILGELSMATMNRWMLARELRRGTGGGIDQTHIARTWALVSNRMKREILRLYRATDPAGFIGWEERLIALAAKKPILVLWGDRDPYIPARYADRFHARRIVHLPRVGHWPPVEVPIEVAEHVLGFLVQADEAAGR